VQFPCARCGRTYEIADELCVGRAVKVACPGCGNLAVHRVPAQGLAPEPPPQPPPPSQVPSPFADSDDDDFENAWSALEGPGGGEPSLESPEPPLPSLPLAPAPAEPPAPEPSLARRAAPAAPPAAARPDAPDVAATAPPAPRAPAAPAKPAPSKAPVRRPAPPPSIDDEEPVMVTAELVLRRSTRRARMVSAAVAVVAIAAVVGGGAVALKFKRSALPGAGSRRSAGGEGAGPATAGLSEADIAKLMGRKAPEPDAGAARPAPRAPAADRPKHEKLALKDRELLDLLKKKGDASVTVQEDVVEALATTRGSLDEQAIEGTLSRNSASFAACVSRAVAASPDQRLPATKVNVELTIRPSGRVSKAAVQEAAIARLPLGQCIAQAAKRMVFPGFDGEPIELVVPLKLKVGL
jgi:hypothetical protein